MYLERQSTLFKYMDFNFSSFFEALLFQMRPYVATGSTLSLSGSRAVFRDTLPIDFVTYGSCRSVYMTCEYVSLRLESNS